MRFPRSRITKLERKVILKLQLLADSASGSGTIEERMANADKLYEWATK